MIPVFRSGDCRLVGGDGLVLSFLGDKSVDAIITDHPYDIASNKGGNRKFAEYNCFRYRQKDFDEKSRVLKDGCFLVEFLPEENAENYEYLYQIKEMAKMAGFEYYAKVPWVKGDFVSNCGRKSRNSEDVIFFTKGRARNLRTDAKRNLADPTCEHYMSGAAGMLPIEFDFPKPKIMIHQAEKPVGLLRSIVRYVTKPSETILDQFAGSGALGEAAAAEGRKAVLVEIDEKYVEAISKRLSLKKECDYDF